MSKVLITGGAGYIGSMLSTKLLSLGHKVTVVDLLKYDKGSLNHLYFNKNFELICEDVRKKSLMKKLVKKNDFIIPLAALVGAPLCEKFKKDAVSTNLGTIKTLCEISYIRSIIIRTLFYFKQTRFICQTILKLYIQKQMKHQL